MLISQVMMNMILIRMLMTALVSTVPVMMKTMMMTCPYLIPQKLYPILSPGASIFHQNWHRMRGGWASSVSKSKTAVLIRDGVLGKYFALLHNKHLQHKQLSTWLCGKRFTLSVSVPCDTTLSCIYSLIQTAMDLYTRAPKGYKNLSKTLRLPSGRHLERYKNFITQTPGVVHENIHWMLLEANRRKLSKNGREGFIVFDEVSIQVCFETYNGISDMS